MYNNRPILRAWGATALCALAAGCHANTRRDAREVYKIERAGYLLETSIGDSEFREEIARLLDRTRHELELLFPRAASAPAGPSNLRIILLSSEAERIASEELRRPGSTDGLRMFPARSSRSTLSATLAMPRSDLYIQQNGKTQWLLPESVSVSMAHEAAHLWIFSHIPGERQLPEWLHEGIAECVAERATGATIFARESARELLRALDRGEAPTLQDLFQKNPRESRSPQLWTVAAWWRVRTLAREGSVNLQNISDEVLATAGDAKAAIEIYKKLTRAPDSLLPLRAGIEALAESQPWWSVGRDITEISPGVGREGGFLLSPIPGTAVWNFMNPSRDFSKFDLRGIVTLVDGGSPELWLGLGFDDGGNGIRATIRASGRIAVERVIEGQPQYADEAVLGSGLLPAGRAVSFRAWREGRRIHFEIGGREAAVPLPRETEIPAGRFGIGARGGAFLVTGISIP